MIGSLMHLFAKKKATNKSFFLGLVVSLMIRTNYGACGVDCIR